MNMKKIICIGDSNTYGYDPRSYLADRYAKNVRWTGRLEAAGFEVINLGMNGICIPKDGRSMVPLLRQYEPYDICIVMLGSNDLLEGADAGECAERMRHFLEGLPRKVLLISPVPFVQGQWISDPSQIKASEELGYEYRRIAESMHIPFADAGNWNVKLSYDGVHYLPEGHEAFAEGLAETIRNMKI
jgi:lysophospholipase L1-like esterase